MLQEGNKILNCSIMYGKISNGELLLSDYKVNPQKDIYIKDSRAKAIEVNVAYGARYYLEKKNLDKLLFVNQSYEEERPFIIFYYSLDKELSEEDMKEMIMNSKLKLLVKTKIVKGHRSNIPDRDGEYSVVKAKLKHKFMIIQDETPTAYLVYEDVDSHFRVNKGIYTGNSKFGRFDNHVLFEDMFKKSVDGVTIKSVIDFDNNKAYFNGIFNTHKMYAKEAIKIAEDNITKSLNELKILSEDLFG